MKIRAEGSFDAAHLLGNYEGKCRNLHGHTYLYEVEVEAEEARSDGMVVDFNRVKEIVDEYDHAFLYPEHASTIEKALFTLLSANSMKVKALSAFERSTAENIATQLANELFAEPDVKGVTVRLWETPKHRVEVTV